MPDPKNMPKFAVAETSNPAPVVPPAGIAVPLCAVIDPTAETAFVDAMVSATAGVVVALVHISTVPPAEVPLPPRNFSVPPVVVVPV